MDSLSTQNDVLAARAGRLYMRQRLGIEADKEAQVFGQGANFFHIENWDSSHSVIRWLLQLALLYRRGQRNALDIEIRRNDVPIDGLPSAFDGYTLLHLSDLHLDMHTDHPAALAARLREVDYDAVAITGDFRAKTFGDFRPALEAMERVRLHLKEPIYAVLGNHDSLHMVLPLEAMGIRVLLNESLPLRRGEDEIYLAGVDDPHYFRTDNLEKASEMIPEGAPAILLAHTPEIYKQAASAGFTLMLSGHTHGGQICLPGGYPIMVNANCPRRFCRGAWKHGSLTGYTSVGSGVSIVDVRLNCRPEITLHRLRSGPA